MVLKVRERASRLWLVAGLVVAGVLFAGGIAFAASQTIVGQGDNTFSAATYTTDQGEVVQLNVTGSSHNATARQNGPDGQALFRSPAMRSSDTSRWAGASPSTERTAATSRP